MLLKGRPSPETTDSFRETAGIQWKLPLLGSVLVHVFVMGGSIFSSYLFPERTIEEIHTVELVNIEESMPAKKPAPAQKNEAKQAKPAPPEKAPEPEPEPEPEKISTAVVEESTRQQVEESAPPEVISLKPRLTKKVINPPEKIREKEKRIDQALERVKRELARKRAEKKARLAEEEAKAYARQAVNDLRDLLQSENITSTEETPAPAREVQAPAGVGSGKTTEQESSGRSGSTVDQAVLKQYLATVYLEIQSNWILPEVTDWRDDLEAVLAITITREGTVIKSKFERPSSNIYFNRFVEKTVNKSSPLPPFPATLDREQIELGLIFHPEGLE